jgi:chromosome segregation ATPase
MASEESEERWTNVSLPEDLTDWLEREARSRNVDRDRLLAELVSAHRQIDDGDGQIELDAATIDPGEVPEVVESRFDDQRETFMDLLEDVRRRVIQVKRETDAKAPADHHHEELLAELEAVDERYEELEEDLVTLQGTVDAVRDDLVAGFDNYEEVLEYLADETERLDQRLDKIARALVEVREEVQRQSNARNDGVSKLKLAANRHGIRSAVCEECGETVEIGLLTDSACPHCSSRFSDLAPKQRLFGSHTLESATPPALDGEVATDEDTDFQRTIETGDRSAADGERPDGDGGEPGGDAEDFGTWPSAAEKEVETRPETDGDRERPFEADVDREVDST